MNSTCDTHLGWMMDDGRWTMDDGLWSVVYKEHRCHSSKDDTTVTFVLTFGMHFLFFVVCRLPSAVCRLPSAVCRLLRMGYM